MREVTNDIFQKKVIQLSKRFSMKEITNGTKKVNVTLSNKNCEKGIYVLFNDLIAKNKFFKKGIGINFLDFKDMPDGCFFIKNDADKKIICYICEICSNPLDNLESIKKKMYNGYLHCQTFFMVSRLLEYTIEYKNCIFGTQNITEEIKKIKSPALIFGRNQKIPPGIINNNSLKEQLFFKQNTICYNYQFEKKIEYRTTINYTLMTNQTSIGEYEVEMSINCI